MRPPDPYEIAIAILPEDIDALGHVNNVVYLRWVQDAAVAHWNALTTDAQRAEALWVVARHEIDYRRPAEPGEALVARTWVGQRSRHTYERHTEILRASDRSLVARARTLWVPLDPQTRRPKALSDELRRTFSIDEAPQ